MNDEFINAAQAARRLGVTRQRIYELASAGRLGQRIAGYWVFRMSEIDSYAESRSQQHGGRPTRPPTASQASQLTVIQRVADYIEAALAFAIVQRHPDGGFVGEALDFPGLTVRQESRAMCIQELRKLLEVTIVMALRNQQPLPQINGITLDSSET